MWTKVHQFSFSNLGGVVVDKVFFRFLTCPQILAPKFFGGSAPYFLDLHYKIHADSDQVAKFQGDRSSELKERVAKKVAVCAR